MRNIILLTNECWEIKDYRKQCRSDFPGRKNWEDSKAGYHNKVLTIDNGKYSGRCRFTHYTYRPIIQSFCIFNSSKLFTVLYGITYTIRAGRGYFWDADELGVRLVRKSDGADYHIESDDVKSNFVSIRAKLLENVKLKKLARINERESLKLLDDLSLLFVCPRDSQKAGNCLAGTLAFAKRHGLPNNLHSHVTGDVLKKLVRVEPRIMAVFIIAAKRSAIELQNGVCDLAQH